MSFIASKILWVFLSPGNLLVLSLVMGAYLGVSHSKRLSRVGHGVCFIVAMLFFILAILPVGSWLLTPLENRFPPQKPEDVAGILLIGGDEKPYLSEVRGQPIYLDSGRRYIQFAALARQYPQAKLVFSGGPSQLAPSSGMKDAEVVRQVLDSLGVPVQRMLFEEKSRNTHENAVFAYDMVHPTSDQKWLLVTSAFHMPRAMACFRKAGWNVVPATTGYFTDGTFYTRLNFNLGEHLMETSLAVHEYVGLLAYWLMGYTDTPWPN